MIPLFKVKMSENIDRVTDTLHSGALTQGKKVEEFEAALRKRFNHPYVATVNSATAGLTIALRSLNLPEKAEVLATPLTCFATTCAILENRLNIKWIDVDPQTCNMDLQDLKRKISPETKAIVFVHWGGAPIDLDTLFDIAGDIPIIEDCAHAFGATYKGQALGTYGKTIAIYSFQAIKHLTTGDGGAILLPTERLYERAKLLRWFGISREIQAPPGSDYRLEADVPEWGYKFHMNDINASIGLCNIPLSHKVVDAHQQNSAYYDEQLQNIPNVTLLQKVPEAISACWLYSIKVKNKLDFMKYMTEKNIQVSQVHKRNDLHSTVLEFAVSLPQLDELEKELVCIPVGWWLTEEEKQYIVTQIKHWSERQFVEIRELERSDKEDYYGLLYEMNGVYPSKEKFDRVFDELFLHNCKIYVVVTEGRLVSSVKVIYEDKFWERNAAHIEDVVTTKDQRGRGYASMLLAHIKKEAIRKNCYKIILNCREKVKTFYEKNGFEVGGAEMRMIL